MLEKTLRTISGTSLMVQWLRLCAASAGGLGLTLGWRTKGPPATELLSPGAATTEATRHNQRGHTLQRKTPTCLNLDPMKQKKRYKGFVSHGGNVERCWWDSAFNFVITWSICLFHRSFCAKAWAVSNKRGAPWGAGARHWSGAHWKVEPALWRETTG